ASASVERSGVPPRPRETMELGGRAGEVEPLVVRREERLVAADLLHRPLLAGREPRERLDERLDVQRTEPWIEGQRRLGLAERHAPLREDRSGVELGVHAVERDPDLLVAVANRPGDRDRPAVLRQERGMAVDPAERRDGERVGRDLPREAEADDEVGTHGREQRGERAAARRQEHVEIGRSAHDEIRVPRVGAEAALAIEHREERDRFVPGFAHGGVETLEDRWDPRDEDDAPAHWSRSTRAPEDWLRALTTISSTLTCHGRVSAKRMHSAMSSGRIASTPR